MEIIQARDPLYVGRQGPRITLGGISLSPAKAREIGERLVMLADAIGADQQDDELKEAA